jgi:hypothetical protein
MSIRLQKMAEALFWTMLDHLQQLRPGLGTRRRLKLAFRFIPSGVTNLGVSAFMDCWSGSSGLWSNATGWFDWWFDVGTSIVRTTALTQPAVELCHDSSPPAAWFAQSENSRTRTSEQENGEDFNCGGASSSYSATRLWRKTSREQTPHEQRTFQLRLALARSNFIGGPSSTRPRLKNPGWRLVELVPSKF